MEFFHLNRLIHYVFNCNFDYWAKFYLTLLTPMKLFFKINWKPTDLMSHVLKSSCGQIKILIIKNRGETGQIIDCLHLSKIGSIHYIAVGSKSVYVAANLIAANGDVFMPPQYSIYFDLSQAQVNGHSVLLD